MRLVPVIAVGVLILLSAANAQAPATRTLNLRGDRFKPLTYDELNPDQKALIEHLYAGERGGTTGPFNVLLRSPQMGDIAQKLGAELRFHSAIPARLRELAIMMTARAWTAQYEWYYHSRSGVLAGLSTATVEAIAEGKHPTALSPEEEIVYNFVDELIRNKQVSDAKFKAAIALLNERGVVDLTALVGYYGFVSNLLNLDRYPLPDGAKPELKPLS